MTPDPDKTNLQDWPATQAWFDKTGILCMTYKKGVQRNMEETRITFDGLQRMAEGKKICILADVSQASESSKEIRDFSATRLPLFVKAIALVSSSPVGRMIANLLIGTAKLSYHIKVFGSEQDAKQWLKSHL